VDLFSPLFVFSLKMIETFVRAAFRRPPVISSLPPEDYTPEEQVLFLERVRVQCGYREGWLFYRCQELDLHYTFNRLRASGALDRFRREEADLRRPWWRRWWRRARSRFSGSLPLVTTPRKLLD
jgi:hypothetical protein